MLPRIGITTSLNEGEQRLRLEYVRAVEKAGGLPVIVPMVVSKDLRSEVAGSLDGLIVTGGPAITRGLVGTLPEDIDDTEPFRQETDEWIARTFIDDGRPILGICYGMQLVNALQGGTIYADVEMQREGTQTHSEKRGGTTHPFLVKAGSRLRSLLNTSRLTVNTRHVQAVKDLGEDLRISGAAPDGVIEAIEGLDDRFIGLQFHPERMDAEWEPVFSWLVEQTTHRVR